MLCFKCPTFWPVQLTLLLPTYDDLLCATVNHINSRVYQSSHYNSFIPFFLFTLGTDQNLFALEIRVESAFGILATLLLEVTFLLWPVG